MRTIAVLFCILLLFAVGHAAGNDAVLGVWTVERGDARVEITNADNGTLEGKIVWLQKPLVDKGLPHEGEPKRDVKNPDDARKNDLLLGLRILHDFKFDSENLWKGGKIYDPHGGKTYSCKMTLVDSNTLEVRGYIGISLLGRTEVWTRYTGDSR